jgi:hypothetical protein
MADEVAYVPGPLTNEQYNNYITYGDANPNTLIGLTARLRNPIANIRQRIQDYQANFAELDAIVNELEQISGRIHEMNEVDISHIKSFVNRLFGDLEAIGAGNPQEQLNLDRLRAARDALNREQRSASTQLGRLEGQGPIIPARPGEGPTPPAPPGAPGAGELPPPGELLGGPPRASAPVAPVAPVPPVAARGRASAPRGGTPPSWQNPSTVQSAPLPGQGNVRPRGANIENRVNALRSNGLKIGGKTKKTRKNKTKRKHTRKHTSKTNKKGGWTYKSPKSPGKKKK